MILSIVPVNSQATTQNNKTVSADTPSYTYFTNTSRTLVNPAVFTNRKKGDEIFEVEVGLGNAKKDTKYTLNAYLAGDNLFCSNEVAAGNSGETKLLFNVKLDADYQGFVPLNNKAIDWRVYQSGEDDPIILETTNLEIYFIPNKSTAVAPYGIPIELMRSLAKYFSQASDEEVQVKYSTVRFNSAEDDTWTIQKCVDFAFKHNPPRYDNIHGAPHFLKQPILPDNIKLYYLRWLDASSDPTAIENCYDMASVAQYLLYLMADYKKANLKWAYMKPFGYLKETNLIGRGQCNNPFYGNTPRWSGSKVVGQTDNKRSGFKNHAFVKIVDTNRIVDACAGPHYGTETPGAYVTAAVDTTTPAPPYYDTGVVADITYHTGVTSSIVSTNLRENKNVLDEKSRKEFIDVVGYTEDHLKLASNNIVSQKWPSPLTCIAFDEDWFVGFQETVIDSQEVVKFWRLQKDDQTCEIHIRVSNSGGKNSHETFIGIGSTHSHPEPIFAKGHKNLGEISAQYDDESRMVWVKENIVFDVESRNTLVDLKTIAIWLNSLVSDSELAAPLPAIKSVIPSNSVVNVGEDFSVDVDCSPGLTLSFEPVGGIELKDIRSSRLIFKATEKSELTLTVLAVNEETGVSVSESVTIEIK